MTLPILFLVAILLFSGLFAWWQSGRKSTEGPVRAMMFVGYFWLYTFGLVLLAVLVYWGRQRFFL